jgi:D-glycero-D-manno-heptose 1,7-bisphosphate phosphatase
MTTYSKKLIIFDRDGCVNKLSANGKYITNLREFVIYEDFLEFFKFGDNLGFKFAIATNQQGIALGIYTIETVLAMHQILLKKVNSTILKFPIFICPHLSDTCNCRKPSEFLLNKALNFHSVYTQEAVFIGDSYTDELAASRAGIDFIKLDRSLGTDLSVSKSVVNNLAINNLQKLL